MICRRRRRLRGLHVDISALRAVAKAVHRRPLGQSRALNSTIVPRASKAFSRGTTRDSRPPSLNNEMLARE